MKSSFSVLRLLKKKLPSKRTTLKRLEKVIKKYPELIQDIWDRVAVIRAMEK